MKFSFVWLQLYKHNILATIFFMSVYCSFLFNLSIFNSIQQLKKKNGNTCYTQTYEVVNDISLLAWNLFDVNI